MAAVVVACHRMIREQQSTRMWAVGFPAEEREFYLLQSVHTDCGAHSASYYFPRE
jgi:hypothetical protein